MKLNALFRAAKNWFYDTPERALDRAYNAALTIKAIEDEHFGGQKISADTSDYSDSVISYFEEELKKYLKTVKIRLAEFKSSRSAIGSKEPPMETSDLEAIDNPSQYSPIDFNERQSIIIEKLNFIDEIVAKYSTKERAKSSSSLIPVSQIQVPQNNSTPSRKERNGKVAQKQQNSAGEFEESAAKKKSQALQTERVSAKGVITSTESFSNKTGVLPRSILRTVNRLQRELDPNAEEDVVKKFRNSKLKTVISIKFILTLIIIPILTQQVTKTFIVGPIVDRVRTEESAVVFLNRDMEEEAFVELNKFEEELHFRSLLGGVPKLAEEEQEELVREKAKELAQEYRHRSADAIKNIFADLFSLLAFGVVIVNSKEDISVLKSFLDDIVYGLSDSAKAFLIILFTDMFVGFHSPHGWEVILEGISRHLGIPESREFIFLFIATFPVILDSVIKYWIFRYLNRISPSAVATYRNMNE